MTLLNGTAEVFWNCRINLLANCCHWKLYFKTENIKCYVRRSWGFHWEVFCKIQKKEKWVPMEWKHLNFLLSIFNHSRQFFLDSWRNKHFSSRKVISYKEISLLCRKTEFYKQITRKACSYIEIYRLFQFVVYKGSWNTIPNIQKKNKFMKKY